MPKGKKSATSKAIHAMRMDLKELRKKLEEAGKRPNAGDIAHSFIVYMGGEKEFAARLAEEFKAAPPGSISRQRILSVILQALKNDDNYYDSSALDDLHEEDLIKLFHALNERMASSQQNQANDNVSQQDERQDSEKAGEEKQGGEGASQEESGHSQGDCEQSQAL